MSDGFDEKVNNESLVFSISASRRKRGSMLRIHLKPANGRSLTSLTLVKKLLLFATCSNAVSHLRL